MLSPQAAKAYYDRFGRKQDSQAFYEDKATNLLFEHGRFREANAVFEFGAGTGRFADKLLSTYTTSTFRYVGTDISSTMVGLAAERLQRFGERAVVRLGEGSATLPYNSGSFDRFISNYVFDLLGDEDAVTVLKEAQRILQPGGLICLVSLARGKSIVTKAVSSVWGMIYRINPAVVGGCRPIELGHLVRGPEWVTEFLATVSAFGITSEVLVARKAARGGTGRSFA